jgi:hypothetical protein
VKLPEAIVLLDTLRHLFPADRQHDRLFGRIVASEVFGISGSYVLVIKVNERDWRLAPKILEVIFRNDLAVKPMNDSWVIYDPKQG